MLAALVAPIAVAPASGASGPEATASAVSASKFKKLKKQVADQQRQIDALRAQVGQPGPQGPAGAQGAQGAQGSASACAGNGSGDVMVAAGSVCIDRYEASIWDAPTGGNQITGAIPCNDNGQNCTNIYARSVAGVVPSSRITYFQAQAALANVGKRLPSNAEWQQAVAGTPDSTACNVSPGSVASTGANALCVSNFGANDMVGNLDEWVGDWVPKANACSNWPAAFGTDFTCMGSSAAPTSNFPGALFRGGVFGGNAGAGPFAVHGGLEPSNLGVGIGFRGAR